MAIWNQVHSWDNADPGSPPSSYATTSEWWDTLIGGKTSTEQRWISGRLLYVIWNAWKERNRRIFNGKRLTYVEVASIARDDILQRERAFTIYAPGGTWYTFFFLLLSMMVSACSHLNLNMRVWFSLFLNEKAVLLPAAQKKNCPSQRA
jgi:hypothetical protein